MRPSRSPHTGFTLIELLIVVAIIAILAAIAVPNFLEAQTRSKVSRAKADMRSLVTAVEAYAVDHNKYPFPTDEMGEPIAAVPPDIEWFETRTALAITTPVSYIVARLDEPFSAVVGDEDPQFHYTTRQYVLALDGEFARPGGGGGGTRDAGAARGEEEEEFDEYFAELLLRDPPPQVGFFFLSHGPDLDHDFEHDHGRPGGGARRDVTEPALYDPTNGTVSSGDILYLGPGFGFPR